MKYNAPQGALACTGWVLVGGSAALLILRFAFGAVTAMGIVGHLATMALGVLFICSARLRHRAQRRRSTSEGS